MPSKAEFYRQMAEQVSTRLVGSWKEWTAFLTTAARLYKYPFHEQMMIYAQRPDATACAEYDLWNDKMGRYVRRGSKGIALVDDSGDRPRLRYVFDISDTGTREHSRTPWLWQLEEQHIGPVSAMLERNYGIVGDDLAQQLTDVAGKLASEYWDEHQQDFRYIVDGSFLEEYDDLNIEVQFKSAATVSIAYALMSRCGLDTEQYFQLEDFMPIFDFNTPATVGALGAAVSQMNQQVLRQIGVTIQNYEREQLAERSVTHGEQPDLHEERRLPDSRPEPERAAEEAPGQVRQDAESVPEGTPAPDLQPSADEREAVPAPAGDRRDGEQPSGADDAPAGGVGGRDGGAESPRSDALGGSDEHLQGAGRGDSDGGAYSQLNFFLSEAEQIQRIDEAENVKASSAFSFAQEPEQTANHAAKEATPTLRELHEQYKPIVLEAVTQDTAYRNACGHSDYENAVIEGNAAIRRAVLGSGNMGLLRLYSDTPEFRQRLHREVIDETYPKLHELLHPLSDADIDAAIQNWNGKIESKHAVVRYMKDHAREKDTAAWLAREFDGGDGKTPFAVRPGSPEGTELPWPKVQRRIAQLIKEDRFYTQVEQDNLDDVDPIAIREALAQRGIVDGQVVDPEKLDILTDKENAGAALLDACKEVKGSDPVQIGTYRGFTMSVEFSAWKQEYTLLLKGQMTHRATLGTDPRGNLTRIDNALSQMTQRLESVQNQLSNLYQQQAAAKEEVGKPFPYEDELKSKSARLVELDMLLNIDGKGHTRPETVVAKSARPSVLDSLKRPVPPRSPEKKPKQHEEVR